MPRRSAASTVSAVTGEGSPRPPLPTERPTQKRVKRDMWSMSAVVVPMSSAVMYAPPSPSMTAAAPSSRASRAEASPSSIITALPPPRSSPAAEAFKVIVRARPMTSSSASLRPPGVALEAQAAEGGAEHGRVDGDDEAQARARVLPDDDLLVVVVHERCALSR